MFTNFSLRRIVRLQKPYAVVLSALVPVIGVFNWLIFTLPIDDAKAPIVLSIIFSLLFLAIFVTGLGLANDAALRKEENAKAGK